MKGTKDMKKRLIATLLTCMMIGMTACGIQETMQISTVTGEAIGGSGEQSQTSSTETIGETQTAETGNSDTQDTGAVQITLEDFEGGSSPDDKERSYTYTYQMPTVTIPGNEEAQNKIESDLTAYVERFLKEINNGEFGTIYEGQTTGIQSYQDLTLTVIRADDKVISLAWGNEGYDQGAHGWYTVAYMNYYTQTGEKITFDSLGSGFREKALELVTAKAAEMQATDNCFFDDYEKSIKLVVLDGTEDMDAIYQEIYGGEIGGTGNGAATPTFSISEDGFTFESGQYVLQPYAVGIVDFDIPASDFGDALTADIF